METIHPNFYDTYTYQIPTEVGDVWILPSTGACFCICPEELETIFRQVGQVGDAAEKNSQRIFNGYDSKKTNLQGLYFKSVVAIITDAVPPEPAFDILKIEGNFSDKKVKIDIDVASTAEDDEEKYRQHLILIALQNRFVDGHIAIGYNDGLGLEELNRLSPPSARRPKAPDLLASFLQKPRQG